MLKIPVRSSSSAKRPFYKSKHGVFLIVLVLAVLIIGGLELTNTTHFFHKRNTASGTIPSSSKNKDAPTKDKAKSAKKTSSTASESSGVSADSDKAIAAGGGNNEPLVEPYGTFVSNHRPSLSGSGSPSKVQSVCNTTPGASCYISFSSGSITKKLEAKIADSRGAVYWDWDVNDAGFTAGSWNVTAIASLNGQNKSTADTLSLEVKP